MAHVRSFILSGQFGRMLSGGMSALIGPLSKYGKTTFHGWRDESILPLINSEKGLIAIPGYSLGANMLGYIGLHAKRQINLGVAYDPSKAWQGEPPIRQDADGSYHELIGNFDRVICYYNPHTWLIGGARYSGANVELFEINSLHVTVQFDQNLHARTIAAVQQLAESGDKP